MGNSANAYGELTFDDVYSFPGDMNALSAWVNKFANVRRGTSTDRTNLLAGQIRDGMFFIETNTGDLYLRRSGAWARVLGDTGWVTPTLLNSWANLAGGFAVTRYRRINGVTHIEGTIRSGVTGQIAFTLPTGFRPTTTKVYVTPANAGVADVRVLNNGDVYVAGYYAGGTNAIVGLNFSFPAEQ